MSHISIFCPSLQGGGAQRIITIVANELATREHEVDLILLNTDGEFLSDVDEAVNIVSIEANRVRYALSDLIEYIELNKPTAMLSTLHGANVIAVIACRVADHSIRCVIRIPSMPERASEVGTGKKYMVAALSRLVFRWTDRVVTISKALAEEFASKYRIPNQKITTIYNPAYGNDIDGLASEPVNHAWFSRSEPVIVGAGRLVSIKDYSTLIEAFAAVREQKPAKLVILGEGPERDTLLNLASELGVDTHIELPGFVKNPYKYMLAADLFVHPSLSEGFGNVIVEALACGTNVVATNCPGGPAEILEDGKWGALVEPGNHLMLSEEILASLDAPTDAEHLRSRARDFSVETIVNEYEVVLTK